MYVCISRSTSGADSSIISETDSEKNKKPVQNIKERFTQSINYVSAKFTYQDKGRKYIHTNLSEGLYWVS